MAYFILLNGPPRSGKSTIANEIIRELTRKQIMCRRDAIAGPMKQFAANMLGQPYTAIDKENHNELFDEPVRRFLIRFSEVYLKPDYGHDIFGRAFAYRNRKYPGIVVADDCGFDLELTALPRPQTFIIRVLRPGYDFGSDSREYISDYDRRIINDVDLKKAFFQAQEMVEYIIGKWKLK